LRGSIGRWRSWGSSRDWFLPTFGSRPTVFESARDQRHPDQLPAARRIGTAYLDEACRDDAELRKKVEHLIEADRSTDSFLPDAPASEAAVPRFSNGSILAERFRVVSYIAAGGMGDVYEVEDIALNARLAMKTIRSDLVKARIEIRRRS
jgi:hypothetical protein